MVKIKMEVTESSNGTYEARLNKVESDIDTLYGKVNKIDKETAVAQSSITSSLENLSKLPDTLNELKETMIKMECTIDNNSQDTKDLSQKVDSLSNTVEQIKLEPLQEYKSTKHQLKVGTLLKIIEALAIAGLGALFALIRFGVIKL